MHGGEYHASPLVGLQVPLVVLVSLPDDSGAEEDEAGGVSTTELACTTAGAGGVEETAWDVMTGGEASRTAGADVTGTEGRSWKLPSSPAQE